ncbi:NAD(P)-binding protein [Escherichia coli]
MARGDADMVSMARPFLADAELLSKAQSGRSDEINTCIGCNQACLDQIFVGKVTSCLVNPRACHETKMPILPATTRKNLAVVGAGPAGLAFAINAAARGHQVTLFDASAEIGGQFNIARTDPRQRRVLRNAALLPPDDRRYRRGSEAQPARQRRRSFGFDEVILSTGSRRVPRQSTASITRKG